MTMQAALPIAMIPGDSIIHRINPLPKIIWVVGYIVLAFSTTNLVILYSMALFALLLGVLAGVLRPLAKASLILVPIASSLLCLQALAPAVEKPWTAVAQLGPITLYDEGIYTGLVLLGRIVASLLLALVMVMTTHPSDLFTTLGKLKVPYTLNFMLAMTLQLIPVFQREVGIIMSAQKSRGMKGRGFSAVLPSFVPVFVGAIERVQQLSISLESRGFGSSGFKTSYRQVRTRVSDWVLGILGVVILLTLSVISIMKGTWNLSSVITFSPTFVLWLFLVSGTVFLSTVLFALFLSVKK